jgi:hypothetical protein
LGQITGDTLTPSVPGLTKELAKGISVAADPRYTFGVELSFGHGRAGK